jgi:GPH family glycoside/pentoside/hexuronide:cation symporter
MGLSGTLVGIAAAIGLLWDAAIDPYVGHLSDRIRSRAWRRHGLMLTGALTMGIGFWASFSPPRGLSTGGLFAWLLATGLVVRTATSIYRVPFFALGAELSNDYNRRTTVTGLRGICAILGTLLAAASTFLLFFPSQTGGADPKLAYSGYPAMGLVFGLVMTLVSLVTTLGTRRWYKETPASGPPTTSRSDRSFLADLARTWGNPSFRRLLISVSCFFLAVAINGSVSIHFLTYYAGITASGALSVFQVAFYLAGSCGLFVWLKSSRVMEKHRLFLFGTLATAALMLATFGLVGEGRVLGTANVPALVVIHVLAGFFGSVLWFLPAAMIADVVDEDELSTGRRREGAFFGAFSFTQQIAFGVSLLVTGVLLDLFAGLVSGQPSQSPETSWRIGFLYCVVPGVLLLISAVAFSRYDLGRRRLRRIQSELRGQAG